MKSLKKEIETRMHYAGLQVRHIFSYTPLDIISNYEIWGEILREIRGTTYYGSK